MDCGHRGVIKKAEPLAQKTLKTPSKDCIADKLWAKNVESKRIEVEDERAGQYVSSIIALVFQLRPSNPILPGPPDQGISRTTRLSSAEIPSLIPGLRGCR